MRVKAFNPQQNTRDGANSIRAHSGASFAAMPVEDGAQIVAESVDADVIGIDEIFMIDGIVEAVRKLVAAKKKVVMATLDMDSEGNVWESVGQILGMAQEVVKCPAVCTSCKHDAYYTFRRAGAPDARVARRRRQLLRAALLHLLGRGSAGEGVGTGTGRLLRRLPAPAGLGGVGWSAHIARTFWDMQRNWTGAGSPL